MHFSILIYILFQIFDSAHGDERIYGGQRIQINQAPYSVRLHYRNPDGSGSTCGGSILSKNLILTAAHCTVNEKTGKQHSASGYTIRAGSTYSNNGGTTHKVKKVFTHRKFVGRSDHWHNDVGILHLRNEIKFGKNARRTQLAYANDKITVGADTSVSGWGFNPDHPNDKNHLYQVHLGVMSVAQCAKHGFGDSEAGLAKHEVCVRASNKSACPGDSGGALIYTTTGRQIGIVSYGHTNCTYPRPSIFAKVQDNLDFIAYVKRQTGNKSDDDNQSVEDNETNETADC